MQAGDFGDVAEAEILLPVLIDIVEDALQAFALLRFLGSHEVLAGHGLTCVVLAKDL